jgi:hypothetical protein
MNSKDITGFIKEGFESLEQATRVLNATGYEDTLVVKEKGIYSSKSDKYLDHDTLDIFETHRIKSREGLVRVLFAITEEEQPLGTLSLACGAEHADEIRKIEDLLSFFKLENR